MIDNVKLFVLDRQKLENRIIDNNLIELSSKFNFMTGEIMEYPKKGKDLNLEFNITTNNATINGSVHKHYNLVIDKGCQNYNDFYYSFIEQEIGGLIKKYDIKNDTKITNLEFGFNLAVNNDPQLILDNNILMYKYNAPNKNLKFLGKGDLKEFQKTDYSIKIYNKSKQFELKSNIIRVEIKITKKRFLEKLGIFCLEDLLNKVLLEGLYEDLKDKIEEMMIVDIFDPETTPEKDQIKFNKYTNPNYWIRIKKEKTSKQIYRLKKDFNLLLNKYDLLKTKKEILSKLSNKFSELLETIDYNEVA